jgi:copper chaperone CopZ
VERGINILDGIESIDVNLSSKKVSVKFDKSKTSEEAIKNAIEDLGYDVE